MEENPIDLSLATAEDMIAELERRGCAAALLLSQVPGRSSPLSVELPPGGRQRVLSSGVGKHPASKAAFLCDGLQQCLDELADFVASEQGRKAHPFDSISLSKLVAIIKESFKSAADTTAPRR